MPYPYPFRANTIATVVDSVSNSQSCAVQLFKPLFGCTFNSSNAPPAFMGQSGSPILRGLIGYDFTQIDLSRIGPPIWSTGAFAYLVLNEDDFGAAWNLTDAIIWNQGGNERIAQFWAEKNGTSKNPGASADTFEPDTIADWWNPSHVPATTPADVTGEPVQLLADALPDQDIVPGTYDLYFPPVVVRTSALFPATNGPLTFSVFRIPDNFGNPWFYRVRFWQQMATTSTNPWTLCVCDQCDSHRVAPDPGR